jgi:DNA-binding LacI/PurR family transcriptional regulator
MVVEEREASKLTVKDIAKLAGVSVTSVSFAINGKKGRVSAETMKKVMDVVEQTGFRPNLASQRLHSRKSYNVALVYPAEASPFVDLFYYEVAGGAMEELAEAGYNLVLVKIGGTTGDFRTPMIFQRKDADAAIVFNQTHESLISGMSRSGIPYVLVDWQGAEGDSVHVALDYEQSFSAAMDYLAAKGHKDIGYFGSDQYEYYNGRCFKSYKDSMSRMGQLMDPDWIQSEAHDAGRAEACLKSALGSRRKPTALCCMSDMTAIHTMQGAGRLGVRIPEDLSLISIDDILLSKHVYPPLTTVAYDKTEIGRSAARLLLRLLGGESAGSVKILSNGIVERSSVKDLRQ